MGLEVKLIKSVSGAPIDQKQAVVGLGLKKFGDVRVLKDSPAIRGMVGKVAHLLAWREVPAAPKLRTRSKPRKVRLREAARGQGEGGSK